MHYKKFIDTQAASRLKEYAADPFDLKKSGNLSGERLKKYSCSACGFDLLYAMQRVDDKVLLELQNIVDECRVVDQFLAMKTGAVINRIEGWESEERQVLHTACRDIFSEKPSFAPATAQAKVQLEKLRTFLEDVENGRITNQHGEKFTSIVQVGIGGSDLGPRALYLALKRYSVGNREAYFISNVDPDDAAAVLESLNLATTLINVVSKSGTTLETLTNEKFVRQALKEAHLDPAMHMIAVTGEGSPMDDSRNYLAAFHMYDYIGGRYSATSMVGAVTLGFTLGYTSLIDILHGAADMDRAAEEPDIRTNPALMLAVLGVWNHNFLKVPTVAILPYSQALCRFPAHLQQCDMESNGKGISRTGEPVGWQTGPVIWGEPGTNGQHAFYQLIHQGTEPVSAEFIGFRQSQYDHDMEVDGTTSQEKLIANMLAQAVALASGLDHENPNKYFPGNRMSSILISDRLTPYAMGALLALYEAKIVFQGFVWDINSFDQEGVQLGKVLSSRLLNRMKNKSNKKDEGNKSHGLEASILKAAGVA